MQEYNAKDMNITRILMNTKIFIAVLLIAGVGHSFADLSNFSDEGCEDSTGTWRCHIPGQIENVYGKFDGDIFCMSSSSESVDRGCYGAIELQKNAVVTDCTYSVDDNREFVYNPCEDVIINKETLILILINPEDIKMFTCDSYQEDILYVTQCHVDGTEAIFSGVISLTEEDYPMAVSQIQLSTDFMTLIVNNLIYILLVLAIIIVAYFVLAPHKPMLKEKKYPLKEDMLSKREKRYGRKL